MALDLYHKAVHSAQTCWERLVALCSMFSRVVCVKQPRFPKHYTGFISLLCCVRIRENFSYQRTESIYCRNNLPVQWFPLCYIHYVCVTHTHIHLYIFICKKLELHGTILCRNQESSPQIEFSNTAKRRQKALLGQEIQLRNVWNSFRTADSLSWHAPHGMWVNTFGILVKNMATGPASYA